MIPALAFNNARARSSSNATLFGDVLSAAIPTVNSISALNKETRFHSKRSSILINGLSLHCFSHRTLYLDRDDELGFDLLIPMVGAVEIQVGDRIFPTASGNSAFLSYPESRIQRATFSSSVCISLNQNKLNSVYANMIGLDNFNVLEPTTRLPALQSAGVSFVELFKNMFRLIDAVDGNCDVLGQLAIDDSIYRLCVGLLNPNIMSKNVTTNPSTERARREVFNLCEFLRANLTQSVSLSKMEEISGLSARVLQYSFQKAFGLRPKEWLRKQRLHAAHRLLKEESHKMKLASVAHDFCFPSPSDFSRHYLKEFGELPSETIRKHMR